MLEDGGVTGGDALGLPVNSITLPSSWAKGPKRSPQRSWAHLSYGVRSTPGDATSAETGLVLMRWRGAGDVAASQGL
eukprot:COSAG01_NODE_9521_length_2421_cov_9.437123_4_plen_76_part_01